MNQKLIPSVFKMQKSDQINIALDRLPVAEKVDLVAIDIEKGINEPVSKFKGMRVADDAGNISYVACPTDKYKIVQHKDAFRPIVEGLTQAGEYNFNFIMRSTPEKASMQIYTTGAGYDTVSLGFNVENSFDGSKALSYGIKMMSEHKYIEVVGYRQVCENGLKIRVPIENAEFVREEVRSKVSVLMKEYTKIRHTDSADSKIEAIQYVVEAVSLLREPVELMIKKSENWFIENEKKLKELIKQHVGKRFASKVMDQYANEKDNSLWSLYNAITWVASHDDSIKPASRDTLMNKASVLLAETLAE